MRTSKPLPTRRSASVDAGALAQVVGVGLEAQPEQGDVTLAGVDHPLDDVADDQLVGHARSRPARERRRRSCGPGTAGRAGPSAGSCRRRRSRAAGRSARCSAWCPGRRSPSPRASRRRRPGARGRSRWRTRPWWRGRRCTRTSAPPRSRRRRAGPRGRGTRRAPRRWRGPSHGLVPTTTNGGAKKSFDPDALAQELGTHRRPHLPTGNRVGEDRRHEVVDRPGGDRASDDHRVETARRGCDVRHRRADLRR